MITQNQIKSALLGFAVGDALGVPVEFIPRVNLATQPVVNMRGMGSHRQVAGTWSDDSSLTFCLAEMLCGDYDLNNLAQRFINWKEHAYWTAHHHVFDIGIGTSKAIANLQQGVSPTLAGGDGEANNGNGSLMRILPLAFYVKNMSIEQRYKIVQDVSSLTHRHIRSVLACFIYIEFAIELIKGKNKFIAFSNTVNSVNSFLSRENIIPQSEIQKFHRILFDKDNEYLKNLSADKIFSSGYVLHTLEASLWCVLTSDTYSETVLKAVNLGDDTDTTGAVAGGLAGLIYGSEAIPEEWLSALARRDDIIDLAGRLQQKLI